MSRSRQGIAGDRDLPEPSPFSVVIGIPSALPRDSRYTASAVTWANKVVCQSIIDQLRISLPACEVRVGTADIPWPRILLERGGDRFRARHVEAVARKAIRYAVRHACHRVDTLAEKP